MSSAFATLKSLPSLSRLRRILLAASFSLVSNALLIPSAMGAEGADLPKLTYLKPVQVSAATDLGKDSRSVQVTFDEACGESLRGVLVDETKKGIYLGAVLERSDTMCLALPVKKIITLKLSGKKPALALGLRDAARVTLSEVTDVTVSRGGMSIAWQETCRPYVGVVMSPAYSINGTPQMSLLIANLPKDGGAMTGSKTCPRETARKFISGVSLSPDKLQVNAKPGKLDKLYTLRIISPEKVELDSNRSLKLFWTRTCRDVPVAAVFAGKDGRQVAMVSAFVPNAPCSFKGTRTESSIIDQLFVPSDQKIEAMPAQVAMALASKADSTLSFQPITSMKLTRLGHGDWLMASTDSGCGERLGVVVGKDSVGNVAMAYLASGNQKVCHVSRLNSSETLTAPLVGPRQGPMPKVFALKVFGTAIN